jgi:rSAM/selenodomain-associated transferase 1
MFAVLTTLLGIFAKHWQPGEVKTRLAASIGPEAAARLHRVFVETLLQRMAGVAGKCVLAYWPSERHGEFAALVREAAYPFALLDPSAAPLASPWQLVPQSPGDLGARMEHFFQASFASGADRVVIIGSDSPTLPIEYVRQAFDELRRSDVVLGPSDDGGYYLLGLARNVGSAVRTKEADSTECHARRADASTLTPPAGPHSGPYLPPIFDDLPWSTPQVWPETIRRLAAHGHSYAVLPAWYDVDEVADLRRLAAELRQITGNGPCAELKRAVETIVGS